MCSVVRRIASRRSPLLGFIFRKRRWLWCAFLGNCKLLGNGILGNLGLLHANGHSGLDGFLGSSAPGTQISDNLGFGLSAASQPRSSAAALCCRTSSTGTPCSDENNTVPLRELRVSGDA
jgi:hypothetical protein